MQVIKRSEWLKAMEESSRAVAFRPNPNAKTILEIARETGYSVRNTQHVLRGMIERGHCKRFDGTTITGCGRRRACSYYLMTKDAK
jgi:hypothetical protein